MASPCVADGGSTAHSLNRPLIELRERQGSVIDDGEKSNEDDAVTHLRRFLAEFRTYALQETLSPTKSRKSDSRQRQVSDFLIVADSSLQVALSSRVPNTVVEMIGQTRGLKFAHTRFVSHPAVTARTSDGTARMLGHAK